MTWAQKRRTQTQKVVSLSIPNHKCRDMDARFRRDMRALRAQLPRGPQRGEDRDQFVERVFVQFEAILTRHGPTLTRLLAPVRRGRPPRLDKPPQNPKGRPRKRTLEKELDLLGRIKRRKDEYRRRRIAKGIPADAVKPLSDPAALRAECTAILIADGLTQEEARAEARALPSDVLKPICITPSRLRHRALTRQS